MIVTYKEQLAILRNEFMQFPELARRYLINLFLLSLELRKFPNFMGKILTILAKFKDGTYFEDSLFRGGMDGYQGHALLHSMTNMLLVSSDFTDDEEKELVGMLVELLDENSLRKQLEKKNIKIGEFFKFLPDVKKDSENAWMSLFIKMHLPHIECFSIDAINKVDLLKFIEEHKKDGEKVSTFLSKDGISYFLVPNGGRWRFGVCSATIKERTFITVLQQY